MACLTTATTWPSMAAEKREVPDQVQDPWRTLVVEAQRVPDHPRGPIRVLVGRALAEPAHFRARLLRQKVLAPATSRAKVSGVTEKVKCWGFSVA